MSGNTFGTIFKITNWGESHGPGVGVIIDGVPPNIKLSEEDIQVELNRRSPGQSKITTPRKEKDEVKILSGTYKGLTTGTPISLIIENTNAISKDYSEMERVFRPGHADFAYQEKYGIRNPAGGGRSSARTTAGTVAAGAIAKKILKEKLNIEIISYVKSIKNIKADIDPNKVTYEQVESNIVRCPDNHSAEKMIELITQTKMDRDSVGGVVECIIKNVPAGLGEPLFDKLEADLAKAMLSINATKGFEIGDGFDSTLVNGSENNDEFFVENDTTKTATNHSGGILGGISTGMPIIFRVAFKPTPTINKEQKTVNIDKEEVILAAKGRHDPCVVPRAVPIVDAMTAIVICDHYFKNLRNK